MSGLDAICVKLLSNPSVNSGMTTVTSYTNNNNTPSISPGTTANDTQIRKNKRKPAVPRCLASPKSVQEDSLKVAVNTKVIQNPVKVKTESEVLPDTAAPLDLSHKAPSPVFYSVDDCGALDLTIGSTSERDDAPVNPFLPLPVNPFSKLPAGLPEGLASFFSGINPLGLAGNPFFPGVVDHTTPWMNVLSAYKERCMSANQILPTPEGTPDLDSNSDEPEVSNSSPQQSIDGDLNRDGKGKGSLLEESGEFIRRYGSFEECREIFCEQAALRDHFHCLQCNRVLSRREEMIRHFKWHKKREESLQYGFMRFSPNDSCGTEDCIHNGKQTHYHCLQEQCGKIYISTSDVQMHSNYHRKDAAIIQEGFQRFRATEDCQCPSCPYQRERTTHFHCRRPHCHFTFKNKADMEKHKGHHVKNDDFAKDGFKKYTKYEECDFEDCKYSKMMNHIHCIRQNCSYVVHSSSQILSHKRKHERRNGLDTMQPGSQGESFNSTGASNHSHTKSFKNAHFNDNKSEMSDQQFTNGHNGGSLESDEDDCSEKSLRIDTDRDIDTKCTPIKSTLSDYESADRHHQFRLALQRYVDQPENREQFWRSCLRRYTANDPCLAHCQLLYKDHYHCAIPGCLQIFRNKEKVREHGRRHTWEDALTGMGFRVCNPSTAPSSTLDEMCTEGLHYHCLWPSCQTVLTANDAMFSRTKHFAQNHDIAPNNVKSLDGAVNTTGASERIADNTSGDINSASNFSSSPNKRRGRPPKYRKDIVVPRLEIPEEDWHDDPSVCDLTREMFSDTKDFIYCGFKLYPATVAASRPSDPSNLCVDDSCMYRGSASEHYHCLRPRCHHATDSLAAVNLHRREFHHYLVIEDGFEFFDRNVNCRRPHCHNNRVSRHYHCVRPNCDYAFIRYNTMHQHTRKHAESDQMTTGIPGRPRKIKLPGVTQSKMANMWPRMGQTGVPLGPEHQVDISASLSLQQQQHQQLLLTLANAKSHLLAANKNNIFLSPIASVPQQSQIQPPPHFVSQKSEAVSGGNKHTSLEVGPGKTFHDAGTCNRTFCKLRKRSHFHCTECQQTFSDNYRMKAHLVKHRRLQTRNNKAKLRVTLDNKINLKRKKIMAAMAQSETQIVPSMPSSISLPTTVLDEEPMAKRAKVESTENANPTNTNFNNNNNTETVANI